MRLQSAARRDPVRSAARDRRRTPGVRTRLPASARPCRVSVRRKTRADAGRFRRTQLKTIIEPCARLRVAAACSPSQTCRSLANGPSP